MPFELAWKGRGVYKCFTGFVSYEEYLRRRRMLLGDVGADDIHYIINDFSAVEGYSATSDDAEYSAARNRRASRSNPRVRIAYVTTDLKVIAMLRVAALASSRELESFPALEEARAWAMPRPSATAGA